MKILRWIAILPASIIALILANGIWRILHYLTVSTYIDPESWLNLVFTDIMSSALAAASFIYAGTYIAPSYKKETALGLMIIFSMICGVSFFIVNILTAEYFSNIGLVAGIFGAIACYIEIQQSS